MDRKTGLVVAIDGVDCTGKTTLAQQIAGNEGWTYFYTPTEPLAAVRRQVEAMHDYATRFFYYLSCVVCAQVQLQELLKRTNVVIDRYVDSTFVMHQTLGFNTHCVDRARLPIFRPDATIILTADTGVRFSRSVLRGGSPCDSAVEQQHDVLDRAQAKFIELSHVRVIDTSTLTPDAVYARALEILKEEGVTCVPHFNSW